jgi:Cu-Zn family superoxide dismutase
MKALTVTSASVLALAVVTGIAAAQQLSFDINRISDTGVGEKIGTATVMEAKKGGVTFKKGDCGPAMKDGKMTAGVAAGEHYDPDGVKSHKGPKGGGHKGDLPALKATAKGINQTVTAPNLKLSPSPGAPSSSTRAAITIPTSPRTAAAKAASPAGSFRSVQQVNDGAQQGLIGRWL